MIERAARLPHGYVARFRWDGGAGVGVIWEPTPPDQSHFYYREIERAYNQARDDFMMNVAQLWRRPGTHLH